METLYQSHVTFVERTSKIRTAAIHTSENFMISTQNKTDEGIKLIKDLLGSNSLTIMSNVFPCDSLDVF